MSQMSIRVKLFDTLLLLTYELSYTKMNVMICSVGIEEGLRGIEGRWSWQEVVCRDRPGLMPACLA